MLDKALHRHTKSRKFSSNSSPEKIKFFELPPDLPELILKRLTAVDIIRLKASCTSWFYLLKSYPLPPSPWLMLPSNQHNDVNSRRFFDVADKHGTIYTITNLFRGFSDSMCIGSSHGWLVIMDKKTVVHIFNPLKAGSTIKLPELGTIVGIPISFNIDVRIMRGLSGNHISKAVLSSDLSRNNFVAAVIYKGRDSILAYCKKGYMTWIELYHDHRMSYSDAIFHNDDQLSALVCDGSAIDLWNLKLNPLIMKTIRLQLPLDYHGLRYIEKIVIIWSNVLALRYC